MNQAAVMVVIGALLLFASGSLQSFFGAIETPQFSDGYLPYGESATALTAFTTETTGQFTTYNNQYWKLMSDNGFIFDQVSSNDFDLKTGGGCADACYKALHLWSEQSIHSKNFKTEFKAVISQSNRGCDGCILRIGVSDGGQETNFINMYDVPWNIGTTQTVALQWEPHITDPNTATLTVNGVPREVVNPSNARVHAYAKLLTASGADAGIDFELLNPRYQPMFSCEFENEEMLAFESFAAGQQLGAKSFRYEVQKWCPAHPVVVTTPTASDTDFTPILKWQQGATTIVPEGQTWSVFYVLKNDGSIPIFCNATTQSYDVVNGRCKDFTPGIVQICSQGQYNPELGLCVVQPESSILCPEGGRYDTAQNVCIFNPSIQYECLAGTYDSIIGKCLYNPPSSATCPEGTIYNSLSGYCESFPLRQIICDPYYAYDSTLDKCVRTPTSEIKCDVGTYDPSINKCLITPDSQVQCPAGYVYDSSLNKCVFTPQTGVSCPVDSSYDASRNLCVISPATSITCPAGFVYDVGTEKCARTPPTITVCPDGAVYDSARNLCVKALPTTNVCTKGVLSADGLTCVYSPEVKGQCVQGVWSSAKDACEVVPNYSYLCINGKYQLVDGKPSCVLTPPSSIVCGPGSVFEGGNCVLKPKTLKTPTSILGNPLTILGALFLFGALIIYLRERR